MRIFKRNKKSLRNKDYDNEVIKKAEKITGNITGELDGTPGLVFKPKEK